MAKDPVCPIYYNDLLGSTKTWTDEEFGCYVRLLLEQWDKLYLPNPYQNSTTELPNFQRLLMIAPSVKKNWDLVGDKFKQVDGGLQNENMEIIREKRQKFKKKQRDNVLNRYQPPTKALPLEIEKEIERKRGVGKKETFDVFWLSYPKKRAKGDAMKAWYRLELTDELIKKIHESLENQKKHPDWIKDDGQFIPYPASWLNGQRWSDEDTALASQKPLAVKVT